MQTHRVSRRQFTLVILTILSVSSPIFGSPSPSPYYYYGDSGVPESQGQGGYGYKVPQLGGDASPDIDALIQEFGGIPEFQEMPNGPPIIPYGPPSSAPPPPATTTTKAPGPAPSTTNAPPPPPPAPTTSRPIVTPITTVAPPPSAPASGTRTESASTLHGKSKILEGVLNVIDGIVEHKAKKAKAVFTLIQPKVALVSGLLQPKLQLVNELVVKPGLKKAIGHVRPKAVQIVTHYRPAITKATMRLTPVIQRLTTSIGGLLSDPAAPAAASTGTGSSAPASAPSSALPPRITINTYPNLNSDYSDPLYAQSSHDVPVFYFANGAHSSSSSSYSYSHDPEWGSYY